MSNCCLFVFLQVFFRCGVLNQLEAKRDELLSDRIIRMQACCRGYLARRKMARRRVQVINHFESNCNLSKLN